MTSDDVVEAKRDNGGQQNARTDEVTWSESQFARRINWVSGLGFA